MIGDFIVSLASYSKRINTLNICLESIFSQTLMPKKIILYFDNSVAEDSIPAEILKFINKGLEIIFVNSDIASHNKYFYTFQKYPDDIVITVDDDVIYDKNTFCNLMKTHEKYPDSVCATRVTFMRFNDEHIVASYNDWISEYDGLLYPSKKLVATGVGGILYPPHIFPEETFDKTKIMNLALTADDLWLKFMELRNNISVVWTGQLPQHPQQIPGTKEVGLWNIINKYENDDCIQNLISYYNINLFSLATEGEEYHG